MELVHLAAAFPVLLRRQPLNLSPSSVIHTHRSHASSLSIDVKLRSKQARMRGSSSSARWVSDRSLDEASSIVVASEEPEMSRDGERALDAVAPEVLEGGTVEVVSPPDDSAGAEIEQKEAVNLFSKLDLPLDFGDAYLILLYGSISLVVLWISSAVLGALDSVPLFPKALEVVGLGFTIWFSNRYLIFKENRDNLFAKIVQLKDQIIGSSE